MDDMRVFTTNTKEYGNHITYVISFASQCKIPDENRRIVSLNFILRLQRYLGKIRRISFSQGEERKQGKIGEASS